MFVLTSETAQKCENNAIFNQNYTLKLLIALKIPSLFLLIQLNWKFRFYRFPPKKFYNINYWNGRRRELESSPTNELCHGSVANLIKPLRS